MTQINADESRFLICVDLRSSMAEAAGGLHRRTSDQGRQVIRTLRQLDATDLIPVRIMGGEEAHWGLAVAVEVDWAVGVVVRVVQAVRVVRAVRVVQAVRVVRAVRADRERADQEPGQRQALAPSAGST